MGARRYPRDMTLFMGASRYQRDIALFTEQVCKLTLRNKKLEVLPSNVNDPRQMRLRGKNTLLRNFYEPPLHIFFILNSDRRYSIKSIILLFEIVVYTARFLDE